MTLLNVEGVSCRTCDKELEPGDRMYAVWTGSVDKDHSFNGEDLEYHHTGCVQLDDRRDPQAHLLEYENADGDVRLHVVERTWIGNEPGLGGSLCGTLATESYDDDDVETERISVRALHGRDKACRRCVKALSRQRRGL